MAKILLVEDDYELADRIVDWLEMENHTIELAHSGEDALQLLGNFSYDLVILDWGLPGINGIETCKTYRGRGGLAHVLFLTGRDDVESKAIGLDCGADDYLTKPFDVRELSARVRAMLRRPAGVLPTTLSVPGLSLETESRTAVLGTSRVLLTQKEYALLEYLMRHPNRTFSSKALLDAVWPSDSESSEDTVRSCMKNLRKKITPKGKDCVVKTIHGSGYIVESE